MMVTTQGSGKFGQVKNRAYLSREQGNQWVLGRIEKIPKSTPDTVGVSGAPSGDEAADPLMTSRS